MPIFAATGVHLCSKYLEISALKKYRHKGNWNILQGAEACRWCGGFPLQECGKCFPWSMGPPDTIQFLLPNHIVGSRGAERYQTCISSELHVSNQKLPWFSKTAVIGADHKGRSADWKISSSNQAWEEFCPTAKIPNPDEIYLPPLEI